MADRMGDGNGERAKRAKRAIMLRGQVPLTVAIAAGALATPKGATDDKPDLPGKQPVGDSLEVAVQCRDFGPRDPLLDVVEVLEPDLLHLGQVVELGQCAAIPDASLDLEEGGSDRKHTPAAKVSDVTVNSGVFSNAALFVAGSLVLLELWLPTSHPNNATGRSRSMSCMPQRVAPCGRRRRSKQRSCAVREEEEE